MKKTILAAALAVSSITSQAQVGYPFIHDPSTIAECEGKYYTFGTGGGGLISDDGWTWRSGGVRPGRGAAPDCIKIGDRYLVAYSATGGGLGGGHSGQVLTMWNKTLDPNSPDFQYTEPQVVAWSEEDEDCDAIDAGLLLDPTDGRLWLTYGTYFGFIRLVELDPKTGLRVEGNEAINIAIDCEATDLMYRNGWYYLLGTHGTCCDGVNSTYNIVVGRSRKVTGPYIDNMGRDMMQGGGKMVLAAHDRVTGPGHFGLYIEDEGVEKMSCHFEADLDLGGFSVLGIRPLLWKNDWPIGGDKFRDGVYEIESERRGYALELAVDFIRHELPRARRWQIDPADIKVLPAQTLEDVKGTWPAGDIPARIGDYMWRAHQKWRVEPALTPDGTHAGGYLGAPYYKITIDGTDRALAAAEGANVITVEHYTGAPEQLWRIEQLTDGTYRIMPQTVPGQPVGKSGKNETLCLTSAGDSTPTLAPYNFHSDDCKWNFRQH